MTPLPPRPEAGAAGRPRRAVLALGSAGVAGVAAALAGCQVYGSEPAPPAPAAEPAPPSPEPPSAPPSSEPAGGSGPVVASTGDVAVGGGLILPEHQLVITQPAAGTFKGFSAVCTHQGCTVSTVRNGTINCACHGSRFSIEDGSVVQPAAGARDQGPLPPAAIGVAGDEITLG